MRIRAKHIGVGVLVFNVGLVILTLVFSLQAEIQNPMQGKLVDIGGASIHVIDATPNRDMAVKKTSFDALVLIHGASTSSLDFTGNLLPGLSDRYRVVAIDRPGHGYSDRGSRASMHKASQQANVVLDTLAKLQIRNPVMIGHSWAGSLVLAALLAEHESVRPVAGVLIAAETHPYVEENSLPTQLALMPYYGPVFRWQYLSPIGRMAIAPTVENFFAPDDVPENYIKDTGLYLSLRPAVYLYNSLDRSRQGENLIEQSKMYPNIKAPILSIFSSEDHVVPSTDHHEKLMKVLPDIKSVEIIGAGHSPHHTRTNEIIDAIMEFLGELG